jgi:hypothetical protein
MAVFDQRNQTVTGYQFNTNGNVDLSGAPNRANFADLLSGLRSEVALAKKGGAMDAAQAHEAEQLLRKASSEAEQKGVQRSSLVKYLEDAKGVLEGASTGASALGGLIEAVSKTVEIAKNLF